jgi:hypothetical protein
MICRGERGGGGGTPFPHYFPRMNTVPPDENQAWRNGVPLAKTKHQETQTLHIFYYRHKLLGKSMILGKQIKFTYYNIYREHKALFKRPNEFSLTNFLCQMYLLKS